MSLKYIIYISAILATLYLLAVSSLYLFQRSLIYYPTPVDPEFAAEAVSFEHQGLLLQGWVINPGQQKAVIYFGGNSEMISDNHALFQQIFADYSVYLVNYRGYGNSQGQPSEAALFADALAVYDQISERHSAIIAYGRSLGSGVAVYLAARRKISKLILLTPYDSVVEVAAKIYSIFPVRWLLKDRFDSAALAAEISAPELIITAENDRVIPPSHGASLKDALVNSEISYQKISGAAHNDVVNFPAFQQALEAFLAGH